MVIPDKLDHAPGTRERPRVNNYVECLEIDSIKGDYLQNGATNVQIREEVHWPRAEATRESCFTSVNCTLSFTVGNRLAKPSSILFFTTFK